MNMQLPTSINSVLLLTACVFSCISDLKYRRIPDYISLTLFIVAIPIQITKGWLLAGESLLACLAVLFVGTILFSLGWMGGGDIKLMAAGVMMLGIDNAATFIFYSTMSGGVLGLISLASRKTLWTSLKILCLRLILLSPRSFLTTGPLLPQRIVLPYAIALTSGAVITFLADTSLHTLRIT